MTAVSYDVRSVTRAFLIAFAAIAVSIFVVRFGVAAATFDSDGRTAMLWNPWDARSMSRRATEIAQSRSSPVDLADGRRLAIDAIGRDATIAESYSALGLIADLQGDIDTARKAFIFANRITKRNLATHLWFIQDAVERDDSVGALEHFDLALRSSDLAAPILFPVLVRATEEPRLIKPFVVILKRQPDWAPWFMGSLVNTGTATTNILKMLEILRTSTVIAPPSLYRDYAKRLVAQQDYGAAFAAYALGRSSVANAKLIRNGDFRYPDEDGEPFGWTLTNEAGIIAEIAQTENVATGQALQVTTNANANGIAARQLLVLPAGHYRMTGAWSGQLSQAISLSWRLTCAGQTREMTRAPFRAEGTIFAEFVVSKHDCPAQWLELNVAQKYDEDVRTYIIRSISIVKMRSNKS